MEQQTPILVRDMDEAAKKSKCANFSTLYVVGGEEGLNFPSILSKIVDCLISAKKDMAVS